MQYQGQSPFPQDWGCLPDTAMSTPQSRQSVWFPLCFVPDSDSLDSLPRAECRTIRAGSWCPCVIAQIKLYSGFVMTTQSAIMSELFPLFPFRDINTFLFSNPPWMPYWNPQGERNQLLGHRNSKVLLSVWPSQTQIPYTKPFSFLERQHYSAVTWVLITVHNRGSNHVSHLTVDGQVLGTRQYETEIYLPVLVGRHA